LPKLVLVIMRGMWAIFALLDRMPSSPAHLWRIGFGAVDGTTYCPHKTIAAGDMLMSRLKYPAGMPLASSCSAVISAACHFLAEDVGGHFLPVQWGAIWHDSNGGDGTDAQVNHCYSTSWPVEMRAPGRLHAWISISGNKYRTLQSIIVKNVHKHWYHEQHSPWSRDL